MTNQETIKDHLKSLHQDAVLWKAKKLWNDAKDPDEKAHAMDVMVAMMLCINNSTKRVSYVEDIQKENCIKQRLLERNLKDALAKQEKIKQEKVHRAKLERDNVSREDIGVPDDFEGDVYEVLKFGIFTHKGLYYVRGKAEPITNFTMKILYHVDTSDDHAYRIISVKNVYGFETTINLNTDDFVSLGSFKKVLARRGDYVFSGADADLSRLQLYLQKDEVKTVHVKTLGYNKRGQFWAWGNGIMPIDTDDTPAEFIEVDEYGIIEHNDKKYFIPACSKIFEDKDDLFVNEKKFVYIQPTKAFDFKEWSDLLYKTYGQKSIIAILFYVGSLYRDIIMKQLQRFPILNLFGPPGAGKGQLAESLMCMFGIAQDQIMLGGASTVVGFMRKFAQLNNAIVWLDEYKNNLPVKFIESFKNIYDGKGYERGKMTNDFTTESTPINSSCILSGQEMPTIEPALFMRCIMLAFEEGKFSEEQRNSFTRLKNDYEINGLSSITADLIRHRSMVQQNFKDKYQVIFRQTIKDVANVEIDDRMIMNISILLTVMHLFQEYVDFPFTYAAAKSFLIDNLMQQHTILAGNNDLAKFWSVIESMFHQDQIMEEKDFILKDGFLFIRIQNVHPLYQKEMIARRDMNYLSKSTLEHYLRLDKTIYNGEPRTRFKDGSNSWCFQMKYSKLNIDLIKIRRDNISTLEQHETMMKNKYKEMGIEFKEEILIPEDLPFPKFNN